MTHMKTIFPALMLLLAACNRPAPSGQPAAVSEKQAPAALFTLEKLHTFSEKGVQDTFQLTVSGKDFMNARVTFRIVSGGRVIYQDAFDSQYLIDFGIEEKADSSGNLNDSIRAAYIEDRLRHFFDEENFRTPAIRADAVFEEHHTSRELFGELKARPDAVSFYYLLGKEDGRYIAWSERLREVRMFYNCC
ncbi:MAG TPA: hypothetical protein VGE15_04585 [Sphingobacteriaceae bacterium]